MALVKSITSVQIDEDDYLNYHRIKILAAKEILRVLKVRLNFLKASRSPTSRESNANLDSLAKMENGLSFVVHEYQKSAFKHQMLELTMERSILSSLLYSVGKKFFDSDNLNDIEQIIANHLQLMVSQSQILQEKKLLSMEQFDEMSSLRNDIAGVSNSIVKKLADDDTPASEEEQIRQELMKRINRINMMSTFITQMIVNHPVKECKQLLSLLGKWRTRRSYSYYQELE